MDILNNTKMLVGYTMGMEASGQECLVLAVKGTFNIPTMRGDIPKLLDSQVPLIEADTFHGKPGFSAPRFEVDYAPIKHHCDVTLVGSAYAPKGKAVGQVLVGIKIGKVNKVFNVLGDRNWVYSTGSSVPSQPIPFMKRTISYDIAFGGVDRFHEDESKHVAYMLNPVGIGYHKNLSNELVEHSPVPCTEECERPVRSPDGDYMPMAFGPVGRGWQSRYRYGGTYDAEWFEDTFPFLPADFNELYYQSAPPDQQTDYLEGGEEVKLLNVTEDGHRSFEIPRIDVPVVFFKKKGEREETKAVLDTLVLDPDNEQFTLTWRASVKLKNNPFEVTQALVGKASRAWWRARTLGKSYYPGIDALVRQKKASLKEED